jgi:murein DD-endopeptidase MepM/ murein hydrolase activator NlpD
MVVLLAIVLCVSLGVPARSAGAAEATASLTPTTTVTSTATSTPTAIPTATAEAEPTLAPTHAPIPTAPVRVEATPTSTPRPPKHRHHKKPAATPVAERAVTPTQTAAVERAATPTPTPAAEHHRKHHNKKHRHRTGPTPTPTVTPTPILNLNETNTISPITCNGPGSALASHPFLTSPFHGWTSIVSYFDHDSPSYLRDGLTIVANGDEAHLDKVHIRTDFPAYWDPNLRLYLDYDGHNGYDYDISYAPVYAAAPGKVIWASMEYPTMPHLGYGNMLMIEHRGGYVTLYGHLSKFLVKKGQHVKRGQEVAISGNTGHSTGPHLHFSVFHNCNPTDPYGWTGPGTDPLETYQGETSEYLWKQQPLVDNTLRDWPGSDALPAAPIKRVVLLSLPATTKGTTAFTRDLKALANRVAAALGGKGVTQIDMVRGAVITVAPMTNAAILQIPGVDSITTHDVVDGARFDLLAALAAAVRVDRRHALKLTRSGSWTASLLQYDGRTLLVGKGDKGSSVRVRLPAGGGSGGLRKIVANPDTGTYAVDLGTLSPAKRAAVSRALKRSVAVASTATPQPTPQKAPTHTVTRAAVRVDRVSHPSSTGAWVLAAGLLALLALAAGIGAFRGRLVALVPGGQTSAKDPDAEEEATRT